MVELVEKIDVATADSAQPATSHYDQTLYLPTRQAFAVSVCIGLGFFAAQCEQSIVATALPSIAAHFGQGTRISWVIDAYLVGQAALVPFIGRISDVFGRKNITLGMTMLFFASTLGSGLAPNLATLIVFRALQGTATTAYYLVGVLILVDCVPLSERSKHQVVIEGLVMVGQGSGPVLGGLISQSLGWRYIFYLSSPIIGILFICEVLCLPSLAPNGVQWKQKLGDIDYVGAALSITGTTLLLTGLLRGGTQISWTSGQQIAILTLSGCLLLAFVGWESVARSPLIPLRLFTNRTVLAIHLFAITYFGALTVVNFYVPSFLQVVRGYSASLSGGIFLVFGALLPVVIYLSVVLSSRFGLQRVILAGAVLGVAFGGLLTLLNERISKGAVIGTLVFGASSMGLCDVPSVMLAQAAVPRSDASAVTTSRTFFRLVGQAVAIAAAGAVANNGMKNRLSNIIQVDEVIEAILEDPISIHREAGVTFGSSATATQIISIYSASYKLVWYLVLGLLSGSLLSAAMMKSYTLHREDDEDYKKAAMKYLEERKKRGRKAENGQQVGEVSVEGRGSTV